MPIALKTLIDQLTTSYMLDGDQCAQCLEQFGMTADSGDAEVFASKLVEHGHITQFQASAALQMRGEALVIGDYHILDVIGSGGMGQVYKARHRIMKRLVAIKIMHTARSTNPKLVQRFYREVEAAARLSHPNIVTAYDAGETPGGLYLAMEYVDGVDLSVILQAVGSLSVNQAVNITLQVARGLDFAHEHNVIHRDVKPGNLLLARDGTVKILDMGLARFTEEEAAEVSLTMVGPLMGTVEYMAPEHAANAKHADHRSDIYSLGCTMYRLLTGHLPYGGETAVEKVIAQREHPIPELRRIADDIPESLQGIFARMVAKTPEERYQSMDECLADLLEIADEAEECDIAALTNLGSAAATTVCDPALAAAETSIGDYSGPSTSLDASDLLGLSTTRADTAAQTPKPKRRTGAKLLLAEIAIIVGIGLGIGLRTYFSSISPPPRRARVEQWRDLLNDVDIARDTVSGPWEKLPDLSMVAIAGGPEHKRMVVGGVLAPNYQVRMVFTRHEGDCGVGLLLPLGGGNMASLEIDALAGSKSILGNNGYGVCVQEDGPVLTTGVRHECIASVESIGQWTAITIVVDGRELIRYEGPADEWHPADGWQTPKDRLGFGVHREVSAHVHELSVCPLVRSEPASRPSSHP